MSIGFLVVDDERSITRALTLILQRAFQGAEVRSAQSNEEALALLDGFTPALVTTDMNRPGGNGLDFLRSLRAEPRTCRIPVVVASGTCDKRALEYFKAGFNGVLTKPFQLQDYIEEVSRLLSLNVDPDLAVIAAGFESPVLDYKEALDMSTKNGRAALAKDVIAMANYGGGTIVVGVAERSPGEFVSAGLTREQCAQLEVGRVNRALAEFIDPAVHVQLKRVRFGSKDFVILRVPAAAECLLLAARQNDAAGLYPGRIYVRSTACESAEVRDSVELRRLLDRIRGARPLGAG